MTKEQLLQERYEVIGDYPFSSLEIGEILYANERGHYIMFDDYGSWRLLPECYPHIFRRLEWWEKRSVEDMPKHIKGVKDYFKNKMFKVADPSQNGRIWHVDNEIEHQTFIHYASSFEPVTEQEYKDYINSNKSK